VGLSPDGAIGLLVGYPATSEDALDVGFELWGQLGLASLAHEVIDGLAAANLAGATVDHHRARQVKHQLVEECQFCARQSPGPIEGDRQTDGLESLVTVSAEQTRWQVRIPAQLSLVEEAEHRAHTACLDGCYPARNVGGRDELALAPEAGTAGAAKQMLRQPILERG